MRKKDQATKWEKVVNLCQQKGYRDPELVGAQLFAFFQNDVMKTPVMDQEIRAVLYRDEDWERELAIHKREQIWLLGLAVSTALTLISGDSADLFSHFSWLKKFGNSPEAIQYITALLDLFGYATFGFFVTISIYCVACYCIGKPWRTTAIGLLLMTNVILVCDLIITALFGK